MVADNIIQKRFTIEEYLDLEEKSLEKHEFHNGEIIKVEGASFYKKEGETWEKNTEEGISQSIHLQSLSVNIALKAIYKGISLEV